MARNFFRRFDHLLDILLGREGASKMKYIKSLDGLRAAAVLFVLAIHYHLLECGWVGVQIFFVLSGFLITRILLSEKEKSISQYLGRFYWRRTLRIIPVYFAYLIGLSIFYHYSGTPQDFPKVEKYLFSYTFNFTDLISNWKNSPFYSHFWSLSLEEQFYLFWPLIVYCLPARGIKALIIFVTGFSPLLRGIFGYLLVGHYKPDIVAGFIYGATFIQIDAFAAGAALAVWKLEEITNRPVLIFCSLLMVAATLGVYNLRHFHMDIHSLGFPPLSMIGNLHIWSYSLINLMTMTFMLILMQGRFKVLEFAFSNPIIIQIGKVSYGMYIFHYPLLIAWGKMLEKIKIDSGLWNFPLYVGFCFVISSVSFYFYEKRFLALKDSWVKISTPSHCIVQIEAPLCSPDQTSARDRIQA